MRHAGRAGPDEPTPDARPDVALGTIAKEWGRIGCTGFGGPPTHIAMLRRLAVERERWLDETEFEDAIAATNLLPGPASTQLAIFCAWRLRGLRGALVGGACFICPGLAVIIVLAAVFLASDPPTWIKGAALGAGAAVPPVAVNAAARAGPGQLAPGRHRSGPVGCAGSSTRWSAALAAATVGTFLVLVLLGCGLVEAAVSGRLAAADAPAARSWRAAGRRGRRRAGGARLGRAQGRCALLRRRLRDHPAHAARRRAPLPLDDQRPVPQRGGARPDHPGPGRADRRRRRLRGRRRAAARCWRRSSRSRPRSCSSLAGARHFGALRTNRVAQSFLGGAGPAAIGAIAGASIPLALAARPRVAGRDPGRRCRLRSIGLRRSVVLTLVGAGVIGALGAGLGLPVGA